MSERVARPGDRVTVSYIGTLDNGRIFEDTTESGPLELELGSGEVFPALERAIAGMREGETRNILLAAEEAFGPWREENLLVLPRTAFPPERKLRQGEKLSLAFRDGEERVVFIRSIDEEQVTLDGNHALAGQELTFALRLDRIQSR